MSLDYILGIGVTKYLISFTVAANQIVTTLHTLPTQPLAKPLLLIREIAKLSEAIIVMTETAADLLSAVLKSQDPRFVSFPTACRPSIQT